MSDLTRRIACKNGRATDDVHPCHSELESANYLSVSQSLQTRAPTSNTGDSSTGDAGNPPQTFSDSSSERLTTLSPTAKIGIGIGGLFLVVAAIIAAYLIGKRSQRKRADEEAVKLAQEREREHFAQASSSREGPKWPPLVQAAELPPPGYDAGAVYDGSGNESAHYHNQQQFGNTNEHGVHEIGPSGQSPVELASSESH